MLKRIGLFIATNIAVIILLTVIVFILEKFFGISLSGNSYLFVFALIIGFGGAFISLWISKWMAKKSYNLTMITSDNFDELDDKEKIIWTTVLELSERNDIKIPEVGIYRDIEPNAFATGPSKNNSLVAVSTGLIESMDKNSIEGVVAHEMAHILNGDMVTMTLLQGIVNTFVIFFARMVANIISNFLDEEISYLAYLGIVIVLEVIFGLIASTIVMAFSRHREYKADAGAAKFIGKEKMIAGLKSLQQMQGMMGPEDKKMATMQISSKKKSGFMQLFSSHPALEDRISALEDLRI